MECWQIIIEFFQKINILLSYSKLNFTNPNEEEFCVDYIFRKVENNIKKNIKEIEVKKDLNNKSMIAVKPSKELEDLSPKSNKTKDDLNVIDNGSLTNREGKKGGILSSIKNVLGLKNSPKNSNIIATRKQSNISTKSIKIDAAFAVASKTPF